MENSSIRTRPSSPRPPLDRGLIPRRRVFVAMAVSIMLATIAMDAWAVDPPAPAGGLAKRSALDDEDELPASARVAIGLMSAFTTAFFVCVGLSVGSFLNVVIYRFPLGMGLSHPPSTCPVCGTRIETRDNIPLVGWLRLRGKCRACETSISARYPLVELAGGLIFLVLLYVELLSGGTNLPYRAPYSYAGFVWILWYTKWDLVGIYFFHCTLLVGLLAMALMDHDGHPAAWRPWQRSLASRLAGLGILALLFFPHLHPLPLWTQAPDWVSSWSRVGQWRDPWSGWDWKFGVAAEGVLSGCAGLCCGSLAGLVVRPLSRKLRAVDEPSLPVMSGIVGLYLGWEAAIIVALVTALLVTITTVTPWRRSLRPTFLLLACVSALLLTWNSVDRLLRAVL